MQQPGQDETMARSWVGGMVPEDEDGGKCPGGEGSEDRRRELSEWALSDVSQRRFFLSSQYSPPFGDLAWRA